MSAVMSCRAEFSEEDDTSTISIIGRFDVAMDDEFFACYENITSNMIVLDMSDVAYMDESALSMLLMMRERFGSGEVEICLKNCSEKIKRLLLKANYQWFFDIQ
ncbi:MAG: STAS domain-containing protein [Thiohalomonadales bacterium]